MNIGVIGQGFVGSAISQFLRDESDHSVVTYDLKDEVDMETGYKNVVLHSDIVYVCLPTPMDKEGRCHTGIVRDALMLLDYHASLANKMLIVLIKSTLVPGTIDSLQPKFSSLVIVSNPEFLTERTAYHDFKYGVSHLLGIPDVHNNPVTHLLVNYHEELWPNGYVVTVTPAEAELTKYISNCYLAIKVATANHVYDLCPKLGIEDYNKFIQSAIQADPRIGGQHWKCPGPDGKRGFGGSCFPKDLSGMITLLKDKGLPADIFETCRDYNNFIRPEQDWVELVGRCVLDEESTCQS